MHKGGRAILLLFTLCLSCVVCGAVVSWAQMEQWRMEIQKALFVSAPLPRLSPQTFGRFYPAHGVVAERITYGTEYGMRIPAVLYTPKRHGRLMPALIVVPGHAGDKYSWYSFYTGILYAKAGAAVLTYDPVGEGERNSERQSGTRAHDRVVNVPGYPQHLSGLMITDVMQGVSYLSSRADVDPNRIAILGYSMGSFVAALTGAIDKRIGSVVLSGGGDLDGPGGYWDNSAKMCQGIPWQSLSSLGDRPAIVYALNEERGPTLIMNGTADTVVDIPHHSESFFRDLQSRVEALNGISRNIFVTQFQPDVSHRPSWVMRPAALWLQQQLHFPNWTPQEIETMPLVRISDWAAQNGVQIAEEDLKQAREGGVMALDPGIPGVPRAELNVFGDQKWREQENDLTFESWLKTTMTLLPQPAASR
jgi:dienelactone hydrolase